MLRCSLIAYKAFEIFTTYCLIARLYRRYVILIKLAVNIHTSIYSLHFLRAQAVAYRLEEFLHHMNKKGLRGYLSPYYLVGRERLELSTNGLRVHCSTN